MRRRGFMQMAGLSALPLAHAGADAAAQGKKVKTGGRALMNAGTQG